MSYEKREFDYFTLEWESRMNKEISDIIFQKNWPFKVVDLIKREVKNAIAELVINGHLK